MSQKIAVLVPCYNEFGTIARVVSDFKKVMFDADIYVYDNNSTDGTDKIASEAGAIVRHERKQGKGNVIRSMFRQIDADCYILVDGDDTYPGEYANQLARPILDGDADMVIGDRLSSTYFTENRRAFHNFGNRLVRFLINKIFKSNIKDVMTGYRAFSKLFVKNFPVSSSGFEIETEMTIHALSKNFKIHEIPVQYRDRPEGSVSKLNTVQDGVRVIKIILKLFKDLMPLAFFGILSLLALIIGAILVIPVLMEYFKTGLVPRFPTLITSGIFLIVSLLSLACGLILDTISKNAKSFYELNIIHWEEDHK